MTKRPRRTALRLRNRAVWELTADVIREWDPYGLLKDGAPIDEFDHEISSVAADLGRIKTAMDAAHAVARVFSSSFGDHTRFSPEACASVGEKLFSRLRERGCVE